MTDDEEDEIHVVLQYDNDNNIDEGFFNGNSCDEDDCLADVHEEIKQEFGIPDMFDWNDFEHAMEDAMEDGEDVNFEGEEGRGEGKEGGENEIKTHQ